MSIIAHSLVREPLEKWLNQMLVWLVMSVAWLGLDQMQHTTRSQRQTPRERNLRRYRRLTRPRIRLYNGGASLLPGYDFGKHQVALAAAIVWASGPRSQRSHDPAILIQKIDEWYQCNLKKNKRSDPRPYYSYQGWCDAHFPCHTFESMQRLVLSLSEWKNKKKGERGLGLIHTEEDPEHQGCYRYAVNYEAVRALMERWAAAHPEAAKKFRGESPRLADESPRLVDPAKAPHRESARLGDESHTKENQSSNPNGESKGASNAAPGHAPAGAARDPRKASRGVDSDSHKSNPAPMGADVDLNATSPAQKRTDAPLPSSAAPSPHGADTIVSKTGSRMTAGDVWTTSKHQLSLLFDRPSYDMWLKNAVLLAYADGRYTVGVPTAHAQEMLQHRYYRKVQRVFAGLQGDEVQITFEVFVPPPVLAPEEDDDPALRLLAKTGTAGRSTPPRWNGGQRWQSR